VKRKKKILFQSDFSLIKTGFARNAKEVLSYLYKTGKYEIVHYCCGIEEDSPDLKRTPWRSIGSLPKSKEKMEVIRKTPGGEKMAAYGAYYIDEVIERERPDVYIAAQDIWGVDFAVNKHWFNKISSVIWTTLDSLPLLPSAIHIAPKINNYWVWSSFATKELNKLGHTHVKTFHGALDDEEFSPLAKEEKLELRKQNGISPECYVIGFVFRNQLRKSVPNLFQGFRKFREENPYVKNCKLLLHTDFREGWDIKRLADEIKIDGNDILTTHVCGKCFKYEIKPYDGPNKDCSRCGAESIVNTAGVALGVTEKYLNEIYNLMDVYCHPFTSGGQEIPIQEAKFAGVPTLVTNYSCGEEMCSKEAHSLPLDWNEFREFGTNFIKASTCPKSIAKQLKKIYSMTREKRQALGEKGRKWALENYSIKNLGKKLEEFLDPLPLIDKNKFPKLQKKNPSAEIPEAEDDREWIKLLYKLILKVEVSDDDDGVKHWLDEIKKENARPAIENYFRQVAAKENYKEEKKDFLGSLDEEDKGARILYVMPESEREVFLSTSLFRSIKELYPSHNLYVAINESLEDMLAFNPYVHKVLRYEGEMEDFKKLEEEEFEIVFTPHHLKNYAHNNKDKTFHDLNY
jgi:glycosyltransferase involved in cell wall biosynthesis